MDHWLAILGLIGTIGFGLVSIVLGIKALRKKSLVWGWVSETISTEPSNGELSILCKGKTLSKVHITTIALWNGGTVSIGGSEISRSDPLCVEFSEGTEVLSASVISQTSRGVSLSVEASFDNPNQVLLAFDTLNREEGAIIHVLHSGPTPFLRVMGTIRDVDSVRQVDLRDTSNLSSAPRRIMFGLVMFFCAFVFLLARSIFLTFNISSVPNSLLLGVAALIFAFAVLAAIIELFRRKPSALPEGLRPIFKQH